MRLINGLSRLLPGAISALAFLACTAGKTATNAPLNIEHKAIKAADEYLEQGRFEDVFKILNAFLEKYPGSEYADDAAYRQAYLHVVSDKNNDYFDYRRAKLKFEQFNLKFPASRYLYACNNWLKILNLYLDPDESEELNILINADDCNDVKKQINILKIENMRLREALKDLEAALER